LKSDKNSEYFTRRRVYIMISYLVILGMRTVSDKSCRENQNKFYVQ